MRKETQWLIGIITMLGANQAHALTQVDQAQIKSVVQHYVNQKVVSQSYLNEINQHLEYYWSPPKKCPVSYSAHGIAKVGERLVVVRKTLERHGRMLDQQRPETESAYQKWVLDTKYIGKMAIATLEEGMQRLEHASTLNEDRWTGKFCRANVIESIGEFRPVLDDVRDDHQRFLDDHP